jgi:hypothetical protein
MVVGSVFFFFGVGVGILGYIFGCDYISYGLVLLRFWVCVLMILARGYLSFWLFL